MLNREKAAEMNHGSYSCGSKFLPSESKNDFLILKTGRTMGLN